MTLIPEIYVFYFALEIHLKTGMLESFLSLHVGQEPIFFHFLYYITCNK